jgi:hypothetical protein
MKILDALLGIGADDDLTDSPWWTDVVFRGLESDAAEQASAPESLPADAA